MRSGSSLRVVVSACRNGSSRRIGDDSEKIIRHTRTFESPRAYLAHVGKLVRHRRANATLLGWASGRTADTSRWPAGPGPSRGQRLRMGVDSDDGALASGLALPGLRRAAAARYPSHRKALPGKLRLRPESARGALPMLPRSDRCAV